MKLQDLFPLILNCQDRQDIMLTPEFFSKIITVGTNLNLYVTSAILFLEIPQPPSLSLSSY